MLHQHAEEPAFCPIPRGATHLFGRTVGMSERFKIDFAVVTESARRAHILTWMLTHKRHWAKCAGKSGSWLIGTTYDLYLHDMVTRHLLTRGEEVAGKSEAGKKACRWVVERTHSWLNRFRRILIGRDKKSENYPALLHFSCAVITWRTVLPE